MARRGNAWLLACIAVVALGGPATSSAAAKSFGAGLVFSSLRLPGSNGYSIEITGVVFKGQAALVLEASKQQLAARYETPETRLHGIHAELPSLGSVSLRFKSSHRSVRRFSPHCRVVTEKGVFRGRIRFVGELGYTTLEANGGQGKVERFPDGFCEPIGDRAQRARRIPFPLRLTNLVASSRTGGRLIEFDVSRFDDRTSIADVHALLQEHLGQMKINRTASARGNRESFATSVAGAWPKTATVTPPTPFQGSATFEQPSPSAAASWIGSLAVELPGAPLTALTGDGFAATLCVSCELRF